MLALGEQIDGFFAKDPDQKSVMRSFRYWTEFSRLVSIFKRKGELVYKIEKSFESKIFDLAVEFGADDIITDNENCIIYCEPEKINNIKEKVSTLSIEPTSISLTWISSNKININNKEDEKKFFNLINELEDNEDVQNVSSNYGIS